MSRTLPVDDDGAGDLEAQRCGELARIFGGRGADDDRLAAVRLKQVGNWCVRSEHHFACNSGSVAHEEHERTITCAGRENLVQRRGAAVNFHRRFQQRRHVDVDGGLHWAHVQGEEAPSPLVDRHGGYGYILTRI